MKREEKYDEAMLEFSRENYDKALETLQEILEETPDDFDALLSLGMAHYRKGDYPSAIEAGHAAERLRPNEQLVHTNLSLYYMKSGDKKTAEDHGLKARIASWKGDMAPPSEAEDSDSELKLARPAPPKAPPKFPDMPWKKSD